VPRAPGEPVALVVVFVVGPALWYLLLMKLDRTSISATVNTP
jgi:hypothetical protein